MGMYEAVKNRFFQIVGETECSINEFADNAGVSRSTFKSILYGNSQNPGIVTIKKLCDGADISIVEFFDTETFKNLEQEIK